MSGARRRGEHRFARGPPGSRPRRPGRRPETVCASWPPMLHLRPMGFRTLVVSTCCIAAAVMALRETGRAQAPQRLLYAGVPGVGNAVDHGGIGILVFDMDHGYKFVRRVATWTTPEGQRAEGVRGIAAHAASGRLFVSTSKRLAAFDLTNDQVVWEQTYEG